MFGGPGVGGWLGDVGRWGLGVGECWSCGEFFVVQIGFCVSFLSFGCLWTHFKELFHVVDYQFQSTKLKPCRCRLCEFFTCLPSMKRLTKVWNSATPCPNIIQIFVLEDLQMQFGPKKCNPKHLLAEHWHTFNVLWLFETSLRLWPFDKLIAKDESQPKTHNSPQHWGTFEASICKNDSCKVHGKW